DYDRILRRRTGALRLHAVLAGRLTGLPVRRDRIGEGAAAAIEQAGIDAAVGAAGAELDQRQIAAADVRLAARIDTLDMQPDELDARGAREQRAAIVLPARAPFGVRRHGHRRRRLHG